MTTSDTDTFAIFVFLAFIDYDIDIAFTDNGIGHLSDLVALRKVRVEVVFTVESI